MVSGFGGLRTDAETLIFNPTIPARWDAYAFRIFYAGALLAVSVSPDKVVFRVVEGNSVTVSIYGHLRQVTAEGLEVVIPR
jgi:trehalose/maltose hydrolase-like predicted phosphorylase